MANACQRGAKGTGNSCLLLLRGNNNVPNSLSISHKMWSWQSLMWDTEEQLPKAINSSFGFTLHWWFLWTVTHLREDLGMIWKRWFLSSHLNIKIRYDSIHPAGEHYLNNIKTLLLCCYCDALHVEWCLTWMLNAHKIKLTNIVWVANSWEGLRFRLTRVDVAGKTEVLAELTRSKRCCSRENKLSCMPSKGRRTTDSYLFN